MLKIAFGALSIGAVLALGFAGFRGAKTELSHVEWFNDMAHQPRVDAQHESTLFQDGRAARQPVPGTVPVGFNIEGAYYQTQGGNLSTETSGFTAVPDYLNTGRMGENYGDGIPEVLAGRGEEFIKRGQERYNISCAICHGKAGHGTGVVKAFGLMTVADITSEVFRNQPDGQIYNTITHGKSTMGAYGPVITVEDRWAIVAYVRVLQKVAEGKLAAAETKPEQK